MAMSLTFRRNRWLIPFCAVVLLTLIYFWDKRVISVNVWDKWEVTTDYYDIENTIDLFDTTQVHKIEINMTEEEYKDMIDTYSSTSEKDWYKTDITIDWVTIYNVWVRLKWNSSLRWLWWDNEWMPWRSMSWIDRWKWKHRNGSWDNRMMWFHANRFWSWDFMNQSWDFIRPEIFEWGSFWPWAMSWAEISYDTQLPLFIKFNKYEDQTYQWHEMISLRVWGMWQDTTLLAEPYSYELYQELWQPSPDTSYWAVKVDGLDEKLFIISELPEDSYYISKWFWEDNWILYKAWNFVDFSYQGEDPTEYSDYFTQKTRVNDYDLSPLIKFLKFVSNSTDEEFEEWIEEYIDVDSVLTLLAIDDFVWNQDSFWGMWSNYYLYYHLWEQKFYLLTRDQNLAFWWMWWGMGGWMPWMPWWMQQFDFSWDNQGMMPPMMQDDKSFTGDFWKPNDTWFPSFTWWDFNPGNFWWDMPWFPWWNWGEDRGGWKGWRMWSNELKTRLLANETFKARYDAIYAEIERIALNTDFSENFFQTRVSAFNNYNEDHNLIDKDTYSKAVESLKDYLNDKVDEE